MLGQLDRITQLATLPNVTIGILPLNRELQVWAQHRFTAFCDRADDAEDLVHAETPQTGLNIRNPEDVARYLDAFDRLAKTAVTGAEARTLLDHLASELRG